MITIYENNIVDDDVNEFVSRLRGHKLLKVKTDDQDHKLFTAVFISPHIRRGDDAGFIAFYVMYTFTRYNPDYYRSSFEVQFNDHRLRNNFNVSKTASLSDTFYSDIPPQLKTLMRLPKLDVEPDYGRRQVTWSITIKERRDFELTWKALPRIIKEIQDTIKKQGKPIKGGRRI